MNGIRVLGVWRRRVVALAIVICAVGAIGVPAVPAAAQSPTPAMPSLSLDSDEPVNIEADRLEVFDDRKVAVFSGNVVVQQADMTMRTPSLEVRYDGAEDADGAGSISRIDARGGVEIISEDQTARGDSAVFEVPEQIVTLIGNVILSQGDNILRGSKLVVDLANNTSRLITSGEGGRQRVQGLFIPGQVQRDAAAE